MTNATLLSELRIGQSGTVTAVRGADEIGVRLMEMGITPGVTVSLVGAAPLGDPLELQVRGYRLSVRRGEAERVELEPTATA